jgi:hypothetical protein
MQRRAVMRPADVLAMQGLVGNRATTSLLNPTPIQRFPASALSTPVKWSTPAPDVFRPSVGMSGGVYILTAKEPKPDIAKVVVKPVYPGTQNEETGETLQAGDRMMSMLGIHAPTSRVIRVGTPEYKDLQSVIRPFQPPAPQVTKGKKIKGAQDWWDVSEATSYIVMSEVPNARSAQSFAEKAATDQQAHRDLHSTLFSNSFIDDLARLAVGDLLIGNPDRITFGKMNLGNIMISVQQGRGTLYAIDTGAYLPKARPPSELISKGGEGGGFWDTKRNVENPDEIVGDFYKFMISTMEDAGTKANAQGANAVPPWKVFEQTYQQQQAQILARFRQTWNATLGEVSTALATKKSRDDAKALTGEYKGTLGEQSLSYTTLKANALYLTGRSKGETHQESAGTAAAYTAFKQLQEVNPSEYDEQDTDPLSPWRAAGIPTSSMFSSDEPPLYGLPPTSSIEDVSKASGSDPWMNQGRFDNVRRQVEAVRDNVMDLGTKRRKGREVSRNRVQAGRYVTGAFMEALGGKRASYRLGRLTKDVDTLSYLTGGKLGKEKLNWAATLGSALVERAPRLTRRVANFGESVAEEGKNVKKIKKYSDAQGVGGWLEKLGQAFDSGATNRQQEIQNKKPAELIQALEA